jgi:glycosyltransferase involved in cell wall biosynthesis
VTDKGKWTVYTTSNWNKELIEKMGVHVKGIIPRPVDEEVAGKYISTEKKLEFVTLGDDVEYETASIVKKTVFKKEVRGEKDKKYIFKGGDKSYYDKKGVIDVENITRELGIRDKTRIVSNVPFADIKTHTLNEDDKYKLYASAKWYLALSRVEGFGMPPVEAMAVGVPSVYINGHAFKQWLVGIPVDVYDVYDVETPAGVLRVWNAKESDIKYAIKTAMEMSKEEYEDLRTLALERSREFYARRIIKMLGLPEKLGE